MAAPSTYSEATLKAYMHSMLGPVATSLGWVVVDSDYDEAVNDALLLMGVSDIDTVSGNEQIRRVRLLAQLSVWRRVEGHTAGDFAFSADGASYSREQVHAQARSIVQDLERQCMAWLPEYEAVLQRTDMLHDPYEDRDYEDRTL